MRKILITGAAGFIGFHLAKALFERGEHIACIDNFNSYYSPILKEARADELSKLEIEVLRGDICDLSLLENWVEKHRPTHIVHLAAQAGVRHSIVNPHIYLKSNIEGFLNILEVCRKHPELKLIYASSSSVYGLNAKIPFSIEDSTDQQASLYGVTKKTNELMAATYYHLFKIPSVGLRFFTVYGPWGRPDMAYFSFTEAIAHGRPIDLYNQGKMLRDFTYIDDIVDGIIGAMTITEGCHLFNLGGNRPVELEKFVEVIEKAIGKKAFKRYLPMQPGDVVSTFADIDASEEHLGFSPKISIEEGIPRFVEWYVEYHT